MKVTMGWFLIGILLVLQSASAGTVLGVEGRKCYPTKFSMFPTYPVSVYGDWIENIDRVTTSDPNVTVSILDKFNGLQNNSGSFAGRGKVTLTISTNNATPGTKTINLINDPQPVIGGGETFSFTVTVVGQPVVSSVDAPTPTAPFDQITVTLNGTGLAGAKDPASGAIVNDNLIPLITVGGSASVNSVRVLSSSATALQAKILFTALVQDVTVELTLTSTDHCASLGIVPVVDGTTPITQFKTRVHVKSSNIKNYVESFVFPQGSCFDKNSIGTINLNLLFAAPSNTQTKTKSGLSFVLSGATSASENSTVFYKFVPANAFARPDGTPFPTNAGGFITVKANPGEDIIPITFKVIDCLGGQPGQQNTVKIQTWMHTTNTNLPPEFIEKTFCVRCIQ